MRSYFVYFAKRVAQFLFVVFTGITLTFVITHMTPINPVEQTITAITSFGQTRPEAIEIMRKSLTELYGLEGTPLQQYWTFLSRVVVGDFGPSLSSFPAPVSEIMMRALPWTIGLMVTATVLAWILGNILGGLAGYYRKNKVLKALGIIVIGLQPIPHYIISLLLIIIFGFLWPILPIAGGYEISLQVGFNLTFILSVIEHSFLPALALVLVSIGAWFMGMRSLVSNIVTDDYVVYAELAGVSSRRILRSYVMRNAMLPQVTGLAMSLGSIFSGAVIIEGVFGYPGLGLLLIDSVRSGDYGLVLGVCTMSVIGVAGAVLIIDLIYPLLDPRVKLG